MSEKENGLQKIFNSQMGEVQPLYPPLMSAIVDNLAKGETVAVSVDKAFKSTYYEQTIEEITVGNSIGSSQLGLGNQLTLDLGLAPAYFADTAFANGVNLSQTIHSGEAQAAVKEVVGDYIRYKGNVKELGRKLSKATSASRTDIPKALRELVELHKGFNPANDARAFQKATNKALKYIETLNARDVTETVKLQKAYKDLVGQVLGGDDLKIENALNYATKTKLNYINSRIARTEFARSYEISFQRMMEEDSEIIGYQWLLSSAHSVADFCDAYAEADSYGLGAGIYPKGAGANIPAHPNCLCMKVAIYKGETEWRSNARFSQDRMVEYLDGLTPLKRSQLIGASYAQHKNDYINGLKNKGFQITRNPRMISKSVLSN